MRGRPPIKPSIKQLIVAKALKNKALKDKALPRQALAAELRSFIEEKMVERPPSEETIMKLISKACNAPTDPIDKPWSMAALDDYPIPPEAIPAVLQIWAYIEKARGDPTVPSLTIRQAKWIARLSALSNDFLWLQEWADKYAFREIIYERMNRPFATSLLDHFLMGMPIKVEGEGLIDYAGPEPGWENGIHAVEEAIEKWADIPEEDT